MRRVLVGLGVLACLAMAVGTSQAKPLPKITGGGVAQNDNSGAPSQMTYGGFVARAIGPAVNGTYPADGQIQAHATDTASGQKTATIHGRPVCIRNLGPSEGVDGGGDPSGDVWEIRLVITHSKDDDGNPLNGPPPPGFFASIFVQDNHKTDYVDENFDPANGAETQCGETDEFQLEPLIHGNLTVHD